MEPNNEFKQELQQELLGMQQEIEQHSTFNTEVWRRSVKRYTRSLYRQNILCVVFLAVMMSVSIGILYIVAHWPWWVIIPTIVYFSVLIIDNLVITRGMAHPDVESKEGLRSLRDNVKASCSSNRWRTWFYRGFGIFGLVLIDIYLWFNDRPLFFTLLFTCIICFPIGRFTSKRVRNRYNELTEEIDELLKEE